jgi:hypothetical protein
MASGRADIVDRVYGEAGGGKAATRLQ